MAVEFALPDLGEDIDEADVLKVLVAEGDEVAVDQPVLEIETEKATLDVPSSVAGRVTKVHVTQGDTIAPGQVILTLEEAGAAPPPQAEPAAEPQVQSAEVTRQDARLDAQQAEQPEADVQSARPEPVAAEPAAESARPSTGSGRADTEPARATAAQAPAASAAPEPPPATRAEGEAPVFASPSVRKFAREVGVDISEVQGSDPGGRITEDDVKRHARTAAATAVSMPAPPSTGSGRTEQGASVAPGVPEPPPLPDFTQWGEVTREPLTRFRRTVARNMATSWAHIPHVTLEHTADITATEEMRQEYKGRAREAGGNLTISVVMIKIAAAALRAHPRFNSSLDLASNELILKRYVNIGVAVDTERGLVVPVIRDADDKNIIQLSIELNDLAERARNNELTLDEMRGATFTVTNLGSLGTGYFSPIINHPEVAVLGLGRAQRVPVWADGGWQPRLHMPMSLTFDHRVIDGADGARFMQWIVDAIDHPLLLALEG